MSYTFDCTNVVPGCEGTVRGESEEEVLQAAAEHASQAHDMDDLPDEVVAKVRASIVEE
jgi:predicted small metal-binding protein